MSNPQTQQLETFKLGALVVPRLFNGLWQLSSNAWGSASSTKIRRHMAQYCSQGYIAFADHYGSSELLFGQFRRSLPDPNQVFCGTKWCVFRQIAPTREVVEAAVQERLDRTQSRAVDLLQFHWQDYSDKGYITALRHMQDLQEEGKIINIGLCNFDTIRTDEICASLGPGSIVSNQIQFSLIDTRPLHGMADVCEKHGVKLLTYGTLCGGFLSDQWLDKPEPDLYSDNLTPSQRKYLDMIVKAWGSWPLFQSLLTVLRSIGDRHGGVSIANVATRWVLDQPAVGAVLIGTRMGITDHTEDNHKVMSLRLDDEDRAKIEEVLDRSNGRRLITTIGDCGAEYR
ncbi:Aldo/keto reductase [Irpex rosettiformis]|uniref:Aldo/keto reductase n=1 Tax=Irpex rosettiformis TaxID=378272 RepID=A0ACB8UFR1_9APHY|nr:Aldo/keto reductase [Irpex rosettiformis]